MWAGKMLNTEYDVNSIKQSGVLPEQSCSAQGAKKFALNFELCVFAVFVILSVLYSLLIPSFEGPDEIEHSRYVEAFSKNAKIHPLDPKDPYRWGYQVHHPPLYYWILGQYSKLVRPEFQNGTLAINPTQNPRFPFIRHDSSGQSFPYSGVHRSLRFLRLPSVLIGILTFVMVWFTYRRLFPDSVMARSFLLIAAMLSPNSLQLFGIVANDGLNFLFSVTAVYFGLGVVQGEKSPSKFFLLTGFFVALGVVTKLTSLITLATISTLWFFDCLGSRRLRYYLKGSIWFLLPLLVIDGPFFVLNSIVYDSPTREGVLRLLTGVFYKDIPSSIPDIFKFMLQSMPGKFVADLCWQSVQFEFRMISQCLFWLLPAAAMISIPYAWQQKGNERSLVSGYFLSIICIFWWTAFTVLMNRHWGNIQIRHGWNLYPFTLVALVYVIKVLPMQFRRWRHALCYSIFLITIAANIQILIKFQEFYRESSDTQDRDYYTYVYNHIQNRFRGVAYLNYGNFLTPDYLEAYKNQRWTEAAKLSKRAAKDGQRPEHAAYICSASLLNLGRADEALEAVFPYKDNYQLARPLYAQILISLGRESEAKVYIERMLFNSNHETEKRLRRLLKRLKQGGYPEIEPAENSKSH